MERADKTHRGHTPSSPGNAKRSWLKAQKAWLAAGCPRFWICRDGKIEVLSEDEHKLRGLRHEYEERKAKRLLSRGRTK